MFLFIFLILFNFNQLALCGFHLGQCCALYLFQTETKATSNINNFLFNSILRAPVAIELKFYARAKSTTRPFNIRVQYAKYELI